MIRQQVTPDGTGRLPFPGNVIPAGRLNSITSQLIGWYPAANTLAAPALVV